MTVAEIHVRVFVVYLVHLAINPPQVTYIVTLGHCLVLNWIFVNYYAVFNIRVFPIEPLVNLYGSARAYLYLNTTTLSEDNRDREPCVRVDCTIVNHSLKVLH